jgi:asparaginyl-tRNA synthetase
LIADEIKLLKQADVDYPLQKKQHTLEFLRENAHLRARTTTIAAIMRVRSRLAYAIHKFFQDNGFI